MTPLRQRFIEDMQLRGLAPTTQRSYLHYAVDYAKFYNASPERLDLEAVRQYELYLLHEKKLSPESINSFVSAVQFLYLVTLEMPWGKECFPRVRVASKLPVVLSPKEVSEFFEHVPGLKYRAALMVCYGAGLRISEAIALQVSDIDSERMLLRVREGKGRKGPLCHVVAAAAGCAALLLARGAPPGPPVSFVAPGPPHHLGYTGRCLPRCRQERRLHQTRHCPHIAP